MGSSRLTLGVALVAVAVTSACGRSASAIGSGIPVQSSRLIRAPKGAVFEGPIWLARSHRLVVTLIPPGKGTDAAYDHLYALKLRGGGLRRLRLPPQSGCKLTSQSTAVALSDGKVAYLQECWGQEIPHNAKYLRTYDPATGRVGYLRPYSLVVSAGVFAASRSGQVVINDGRGLSERLLRLTPARAEPIALPFTRVGYPSWSPDGQTLALDAVPSSEHAVGVARLDLHRNLYLLDRHAHVRRRLLDGLINISLAAWSPDSRWLAFAAQPAHHAAGLYLANASTGTMHLVAKGDFGSTTWIDGQHLAASFGVTSDLPGGHGDAGVEILTLPIRRLDHSR
jgi:hypothetical protein